MPAGRRRGWLARAVGLDLSPTAGLAHRDATFGEAPAAPAPPVPRPEAPVRRWWTCVRCDGRPRFETRGALEEHRREAHGMGVPAADTPGETAPAVDAAAAAARRTLAAARACAVPGCDRAILARGLCVSHYGKMRGWAQRQPVWRGLSPETVAAWLEETLGQGAPAGRPRRAAPSPALARQAPPRPAAAADLAAALSEVRARIRGHEGALESLRADADLLERAAVVLESLRGGAS